MRKWAQRGLDTCLRLNSYKWNYACFNLQHSQHGVISTFVGAFGNVWRHVCLSWLRVGGCTTCIQRIQAKNAIKHPIMHGAVPATLNFLASDTIITKGEIPAPLCSRGWEVMWEFSTQCSEKGRWYGVVAVIISFVSVASGLPWLSRDLSYPGSEPSQGW